MKRKITFTGLWIALSLLLFIVSCDGDGGGGHGVPAGTAGSWTVPDNSILTAAQVTSFNSGNLYYNVHSSAYPDGEIRGQIDTVKSTFSTSGTVSTMMTGDQEAPPVATNASGIGTVTVEAGTNKISGVVVTRGIIGTVAHIHVGAAGVPGPIIIPLSGGPTVWTVPDNTFLTAAQRTNFDNGELYYNVHSAAYPDGEIRGQLNKRVSFASLSGDQEVPAVITTASGTGVLSLDPATNQVRGFIRTSGLTGTQAHIHEAAAAVDGPIIITLTESSAGSGIWNVPAGSVLTDTQETSFNTGSLYFNVHTAANLDGEIRGQILPADLTVKTASLTGANEVPPVSTSAIGSGILVLNSVTKEVGGAVSTSGLTGTQAHIHDGAVGIDGPIIIPLSLISAGSPGTGGGGTTY